jgi:hypothetical protein
MATKEELLQYIDEGIRMEEGVIPMYTKHITSTLFLSGFKDKTRDEVEAILTRLGEDSTKHRKALELLRQEIEESEDDVY